MKTGRPRIPNQIKELRGTYRKDRASSEIIEYDKLESVTPPDVLSEMAKKIFIEKSKMLINQKILTVADVSLLSIYCISLANYYECQIMIKENGLVDEKNNPNPYSKLQKYYFEVVNKTGSQFGFSPKTRLESQSINEEDDPFIKFLNS